eukprot:TRINITY_DN17612_c0_g1_i1.p1 TRINITY_DN17612_c0_g1~~TRINITY_DN17612_c0_g1_i1.p1  ORF type:complete len:254 (+),score=54.96 TRINITY_DN17612_c0_g1_i1:66-827(+)
MSFPQSIAKQPDLLPVSIGTQRWEAVLQTDVRMDTSDATAHGAVTCGERLRHSVLLARLQKQYLVYCVVCSVLAAMAFGSTLLHLVGREHPVAASTRHGIVWEEALEPGQWQKICWKLVSASLCVEVMSAVAIRGWSCFKDPWCLLDMVILSLTAIAWSITMAQRFSKLQAEEVEGADLPLLILRFTLQPCRLIAVASKTCQVQTMQDNTKDIDFDSLDMAQEEDAESAFSCSWREPSNVEMSHCLRAGVRTT